MLAQSPPSIMKLWNSQRFLLVTLLAATGITDAIHQINEGQEHGNNDAADDDSQKDNHDRFEQRSHRGDRIIDFFIVVIGNLQEHFGQGAGLFTDVHHADDHRRKYARGLEGRRNSLAFFDALVHGANGVADNDVAGRFFDDGESLQDRDTAADECAQRPGKARDSHFVHYRSNHRHLELEFVPHVPAKLCFLEEHEQDYEHSQDAKRYQDVIFDSPADPEDQAREGWQ